MANAQFPPLSRRSVTLSPKRTGLGLAMVIGTSPLVLHGTLRLVMHHSGERFRSNCQS